MATQDEGIETSEQTASIIDARSAADHILISLQFRNWGGWSEPKVLARIDWNAVAGAIDTSLDELSLRYRELRSIEDELRNCPSSDARQHIASVLREWAHTGGASVIPDLVEEAISEFQNGHWFEGILQRWPFLTTDTTLICSAIKCISKGGNRPPNYTSRLEMLSGTPADAEDLHRTWLLADRSLAAGQAVADVLAKWSRGSVWGQFQYWMWLSTDSQSDNEWPVAKEIIALVNELRQLPMVGSRYKADVDLLAMSPQSRAAWRRSLREALESRRDLLWPVVETILWLASDRADELALFTVLELLTPDELSELGKLQQHPAHIVRLRAKAALELAIGAEDAPDLFLRPRQEYTRRDGKDKARTWIGDANVEAVLQAAFARAASAVADEIRETVDSGEETHVAILFERLRNEAKGATELLAKIARETGQKERIDVSFKRRIVGRTEEGAEGLSEGHSFSTDVCLILSARRSGKTFSERATLLQAKRLKRNGRDEFYKVDMAQISDISHQSTSSFLLLIGPSVDGVTIPVIPARLLVEWYNAERGSRTVRPEFVSRLGRSLAPWLLSELVGLWTGDHRAVVVDKALGTETGRPTTVFELVVDIVPTSLDDMV